MEDLEKAKATDPALLLIPLSHTFYQAQYPISEPLPSWIIDKISSPAPVVTEKSDEKEAGMGFMNLARTTEEWSLMIEGELGERERKGGTVSFGWGCVKLRGPMPFTLVGIAANLTESIAKVGISVMVISTYNTDWIFMDRPKMGKVMEALREGGWKVLE